MQRTMPFNLLIVVVLCCSTVITTGKRINSQPLSADKLGLSEQDFEYYKQKAFELQELIVVLQGFTVNRANQTPEFDDMILPLHVIESMIENYRKVYLTLWRVPVRTKRSILNLDLFGSKLKWVFSEHTPIPYTVETFSSKVSAEIDQAFQYWENHTCIRFRKMVSSADYHIRVENNAGCYSILGRNMENNTYNSQPIALGACKNLNLGEIVHIIGHALGLIHEHIKIGSRNFVSFKKENLKNEDLIKNFLRTVFIAPYSAPYDITSIMHYSGMEAAKGKSKVLVASDPLYQKNMGQRVELSFMDKKCVNKEYCKDACIQVLRCERGGYTDPNNCNQCVCPDGFGGLLCETVGNVHHSACQRPQIITVTNTEQCITMKPYEPFTECHWHLQVGKGEKIQLYFKNDFAVYCTGKSVCYHWVEIKYKGDYSMPGPRFCCTNTPKVKLVSDTELVTVSFKSNYEDESVSKMNTGFQLCYKSGSCLQKEVLNCNRMNRWELKAEPSILFRTIFFRAMQGCLGDLKISNTIRFIMNLVGGRPFRIDKLCIKTINARAVRLIMNLESSSQLEFPICNCVDSKMFTDVGPIKQVIIEVQPISGISVSISDIVMNVCKE